MEVLVMTAATHKVHPYSIKSSWTGNTKVGYESYDRTHTISAAPAGPSLTLSSDPAFRGNADLLNPEQLLVAAASSCQLLSFLAVASRARIEVLEYEDAAEGEMPEDDPPVRITRIHLHPRIVVGPGVTRERVEHLVEVAHNECYIANSLKTDIIVSPHVDIRES
jgi:organic hydroperoxide reductase OsmC/OhrA